MVSDTEIKTSKLFGLFLNKKGVDDEEDNISIGGEENGEIEEVKADEETTPPETEETIEE